MGYHNTVPCDTDSFAFSQHLPPMLAAPGFLKQPLALLCSPHASEPGKQVPSLISMWLILFIRNDGPLVWACQCQALTLLMAF